MASVNHNLEFAAPSKIVLKAPHTDIQSISQKQKCYLWVTVLQLEVCLYLIFQK